MAIRVLVADDHAVVRQGLRTFLELQEDIEVVADAADGATALRAVAEHEPDVVLMDLVLPEVDGVEAIRRIVAERPRTRVIALTSFLDDDKVFPAVRAGASGYLLKDIDPERLPRALESVLAGETALPQSLVRRMVRRRRQSSDRSTRALLRREGIELSDSEWEVLELLEEGLAPVEISRRLNLDERVVQRHLSTLARALGVRDGGLRLRVIRQTD
jgi:two-component system, NarL family, response regulator LiaR